MVSDVLGAYIGFIVVVSRRLFKCGVFVIVFVLKMSCGWIFVGAVFVFGVVCVLF